MQDRYAGDIGDYGKIALLKALQAQYFHDIAEKLEEYTEVSEEDILKITFPKFSVRDYLAIPVTKDHQKKMLSAFSDMEQGIWGQLGVCRIPQ